VLDDYGLPAALRWLCDRVVLPAGVVFSVDTIPEYVRLAPPVELALFRIAQEALTNVVKHAAAVRVSVGLEVAGGIATLEITDNGIGFKCGAGKRAPNSAGMGLALMAERAAGLGGRFEVESSPGHGTTVHVEVPL
jgi:two-component system sensor histidine kinase UhpB